MTCQGTCHAHLHSLMPLLCFSCHLLVLLAKAALPLNSVSEREWCYKNHAFLAGQEHLGELIPAHNRPWFCISYSFHPLSLSQFKLTGEVPQQSRVPSVRQG